MVADRREEEKEPDKIEPGHSQRLTDAEIMSEIREQMKRTREDMEEHWQHTEGAALHAAISAGQQALSEGKSKQEVASVIESAGGDICGHETWRGSHFNLLAEAFVIGTRTERYGTSQEAADLQYLRKGDGAATAASSSQQRSFSAAFTRESDNDTRCMKKHRIAVTN